MTAVPAVIGGEKSLDLRIYGGDQASINTELRDVIDLRESREHVIFYCWRVTRSRDARLSA